jgi:hypothetical protein
MDWRTEPLLLSLIVATLLLLSIPFVHSQERAPSAAVKAACIFDVRRLCPAELKARDHAGIRQCMQAHTDAISKRCLDAWQRESSQ